MNSIYFGMEVIGICFMLVLLYANSFGLKIKTIKSKMFTQLLIVTIIVILADALTWIDLGWERSPNAFWILITCTYVLPFLMLGIFSSYIYAHISEKTTTSKMPFTIVVIFSSIMCLITLGLCFTGKMFDIKNGFFHAGPYEAYYYVEYMISLFLFAGIVISNSKKLGLRDCIVALSYIVVPFLSLLISLSNLNIDLSVPLLSVDVLIVYLALQSDRERSLFYQSNSDELTGLYNRRAYEDDLLNYPDIPVEEDFVYASIDINSLKQINDNLGHLAGDELITGTAYCLKRTFGNYGKVYRTGGDEFVSMFFADEEHLSAVVEDLKAIVDNWQGELVDKMSISLGYASKREFPDLSVKEMAEIADKRMYKEKELYYSNKGVDRRGQSAAYKILCSLYTKILKVNITDDTFSVIRMDLDEQNSDRGYSDKISQWIEGFAKSGNVHPEDLDEYLKATNIEYLRDYFQRNKTSLTIFYRRKYGDDFKQVMMELIPANDYRNDNQVLFLYVKNIDK